MPGCTGSFGASRCELQELGNGLDVPVGELRLRVAEIGAELDHLPIRIEALAVPADDRAHREGVPQVMDAGPASVLAESLRRSEAERLADQSEVVACAAVGRALTTFHPEEWAICRSAS